MVEVVSGPSLGQNIHGKYTYIYQSDGRPAFKHETETDLCLFHMNWWKVDGCMQMSGSTDGMLMSKGSKGYRYPQNAGQTWNYYGISTIDESVIVKCES